MTTNTMKKAAGATNSNGPHTKTNEGNFRTDGPPSKAIAPLPVPISNKATTLAAQKELIDIPDVFTVKALNTKKRIKAAIGGAAK
jgi:hypothetical protein